MLKVAGKIFTWIWFLFVGEAGWAWQLVHATGQPWTPPGETLGPKITSADGSSINLHRPEWQNCVTQGIRAVSIQTQGATDSKLFLIFQQTFGAEVSPDQFMLVYEENPATPGCSIADTAGSPFALLVYRRRDRDR